MGRVRNLARDQRLILADSQDNPGGGGTGDTTDLLAALIEARAEDAVLGLLFDPDASADAHRAGKGGTLTGLALGGRHGPEGVRPVCGDFEVVALSDGRFQATGPFYGGNRMDLGPMAVLRPCAAPGVEVVTASRRIQAADRAMFTHLGLDLACRRVIALKSSVHFRADFERLADEILMIKAPGYVAADPGDLSFKRLPATIRPRVRLPC
jgi:microcystin degradation protein MlrC